MKEFEEKIGYSFKNKAYLETALTHSSYANETGCMDNERFEFLGDSVLSIVVSEKLFSDFKDKPEGFLSKTRASVVCEDALFRLADKIDLKKYIKLGKGEELTGGRNRPSVISDAFEALICAVFLDSDFETAKKWLLSVLPDDFNHAEKNTNYGDYKSMLQETLQKNGDVNITYSIVSEKGPDHDKYFVCAVNINGKQVATGEGKGKKTAEQNAAKAAMERI